MFVLIYYYYCYYYLLLLLLVISFNCKYSKFINQLVIEIMFNYDLFHACNMNCVIKCHNFVTFPKIWS